MNTARTIRRGMVVMAVAVLCALIALPAYAAYEDSLKGYWKMDDTSWDDSFTGTSVNSNIWTSSAPAGMSISQNNQINMSQTASSSGVLVAGYTSKYTLSGDFDIQVDFGNVAVSSASDGGLTLEVYDYVGGYSYLRRRYGLNIYDCGYDTKSSGGNWFQGPSTTDTSGKLRMARTGSTLALYDWNNSNSSWSTLTTYTNSALTEDMVALVCLATGNGTAGNAGSFDNFTVTNGEKVTDAKGTNTGTIHGATQTTGKTGFGNALTFNGTSDSVSVPNNSSLNFGTGDFAVSFWLRSSVPSAPNAIFGKCTDWSTQAYGWWFSTYSNGYLAFEMAGAGQSGLYNNIVASNALDDTWHLITASRDAGLVSLYVDNILQGQVTDTTNLDSSADLQFGWAFTAGGSARLNGSLDDVGIWDRALDANEINMLYVLGTDKFEWLTLGVNDTEELNLGYTTSELKLLAELYAEGNIGASEIIDGVTWRYLSGDLPGDIGGTTYDYGDTWTYDGRSYIKLGSGLEGSPVPEPGCVFGLLVGFFVPGLRKVFKKWKSSAMICK